MLSELDQLLNDYIAGRAHIDELMEYATEIARQDPKRRRAAARLLTAARAAGLPRPAHIVLMKCLGYSKSSSGESSTTGRTGETSRTGEERTEFNSTSSRDGARTDTKPRRKGGEASAARPSTAPEPVLTMRDLRAGDVLRNRFELIEKLGEGGMGTVWRGKDLLKEEAQDRNPFVAIKLLHTDFENHPEGFIALQRETSKQQRLAHPNIATVYDFDRDERTDTVFMTMEVMQGQPMDRFIRKLPPEGLSQVEAMSIIDQLGAGLTYAHANGLVHSDLKPGNCFITDDQGVKLLDFGIARVSKTASDAEGDITLFDPRKFGALTPTYAALEMFEGAEPDPRDDVFALAIMAYILLTGKHPYLKKSAPKAVEEGLKPARVRKLSSRQNRGLAKGLALYRSDRTPTVEKLLADIRPARGIAWPRVAAGLAAIVVIAGLAQAPVRQVMLDNRLDTSVQAITQAPTPENIKAVLQEVSDYDSELVSTVLSDERVQRAVSNSFINATGEEVERTINTIHTFSPRWADRIFSSHPELGNPLVALFERRIATAFDPDRGRYDWLAGQEKLERLRNLLDSRATFELRQSLRSRRDEALAEVMTQYSAQLLAEPNLEKTPEGRIAELLATMKQLGHKHDDRDERIARSEARIRQVSPGAITIAQFDPVRKDLGFLITENPDSPAVTIALAELGDALRATNVAGELARAQLIRYANTLPLSLLRELSTGLAIDLWFDTESMERDIDGLLDGLLADTKQLDAQARGQLLALVRQLIASLPPDREEVQTRLNRIATLYLRQATQARRRGELDAAIELATEGLDYVPGHQALAALRRELIELARGSPRVPIPNVGGRDSEGPTLEPLLPLPDAPPDPDRPVLDGGDTLPAPGPDSNPDASPSAPSQSSAGSITGRPRFVQARVGRVA